MTLSFYILLLCGPHRSRTSVCAHVRCSSEQTTAENKFNIEQTTESLKKTKTKKPKSKSFFGQSVITMQLFKADVYFVYYSSRFFNGTKEILLSLFFCLSFNQMQSCYNRRGKVLQILVSSFALVSKTYHSIVEFIVFFHKILILGPCETQ